jgi:hypothetical protein
VPQLFTNNRKQKLTYFTTALAIIETHSALLARGPGFLVFSSAKCDCATAGPRYGIAALVLRSRWRAFPLTPGL